jgi:hypothetical protein
LPPADQAGATPAGIDTGVMMDVAAAGTVHRTDVGEPGDAAAGEPDR